MRECFLLLCLLTHVQGGPYIWRPRPVAKPLVNSAQVYVHELLLTVERRVLKLSLDVSRLAQVTTEEAYRLTDEAESRLGSLVKSLQQEASIINPRAPECVDEDAFKKIEKQMDDVLEEIYQCTHGLSDIAASYEVEMTLKLVAARSQIWDIQQAMWFCEKYKSQVDTDCLKRLVLEGLQVVEKLPDRGIMVLDKALATEAQNLAKLKDCFVRRVSAAEEKHLTATQKMRTCFEESGNKRR